MVLRNYVELQDGIPAVLHFHNHGFAVKTIRDPDDGREKQIRTLVFDVDWLNGQPTTGQLSVTSEKLAQQLQPYLEGQRYRRVQFVITRSGRGYATDWEIQTSPWTGAETPGG